MSAPTDIDQTDTDDGRVWISAAMADGRVLLTNTDRGAPSTAVRFELTPDEAHELGTKLRRMARKARGEAPGT